MLEKSLNYLNHAKRLTEQDLCLKLAESGKPILDFCYDLAPVNHKDYITAAEPLGDKGACLIAHGDDVMFREFGAGITTTSPKHSGSKGLPPIYPGSFSESEDGKGMFAKNGYWWYNDNCYTGLAPTLGMQNAFIEIRNNLQRIANEVLKNG